VNGSTWRRLSAFIPLSGGAHAVDFAESRRGRTVAAGAEQSPRPGLAALFDADGHIGQVVHDKFAVRRVADTIVVQGL